MAGNKQLGNAKAAKNDEFYTQYADIQKEVNAYLDYDPDTFRGKTVLLPCDDPEWSKFTRFFAENFEQLGLKKLISTSYAAASKKFKTPYQPSLFESESPQFDAAKTEVRGKIFVLDHDANGSGRIDLDDLEWKYLDGDGDFRSEEVCRLREEADIIVTNPPFSLFREFLAWIMGNDISTQRRRGAEGVLATKNTKRAKQFLIIGNMNATTTKDVFPLFMRNDLWMGESIHSGDREFGVPKEYPLDAAGWRVDENGGDNTPVSPVLEEHPDIRTIIVVRCNSAEIEPDPIRVRIPHGVRIVEVRPSSTLPGGFGELADFVPDASFVKGLPIIGSVAESMDAVSRQLKAWSGTFAFDGEFARRYIIRGHADGLAALRHLRPKEKLNW